MSKSLRCRGRAMKILLIAGAEHKTVSDSLTAQPAAAVVIINKNPLSMTDAFEYLRESTVAPDRILVTDGGISGDPEITKETLQDLNTFSEAEILVLTRDYLMECEGVSIKTTQWFRAVESDFQVLFDGRRKDLYQQSEANIWKRQPDSEQEASIIFEPKSSESIHHNKKHEGIQSRRKWRFSKSREVRQSESVVSLASSKAVVFTGRRGAGITGTAVNTAWTANKHGINTILIDLDVDFRSTNLYFGEFYRQADEDDDLKASLVRMLARPQSFQTSAVRVDKDLWVTSLGYDFCDNRLLEQHFTEPKIVGLVTLLKHNFDLVVVDLPLDMLFHVPNVMNCIDVIALCMENTIYSAFTTLRSIVNGFDQRERIAYLASKARLVATKYNDEATFDDEITTPDKLSRLIVSEGFSEDFTVEMPVAGYVPYVSWFGKQIESDVSVIETDSLMNQAYNGILLRLLGAAR